MSALDSISITWHVDDIVSRAEDQFQQLTRAQAQRVLVNIGRDHDANIGINWEVIDTHIELYLAHLTKHNLEQPESIHC